MADFNSDDAYLHDPDRLILDLNGLLLQGERDVPELLAQTLERNAEKYGPVLKISRGLYRLGEFERLLPLVGFAVERFPNSIDLAVLQADSRFALGLPPDLNKLHALTEQTGRKRSQAAQRLMAAGDADRGLALLGATGGDKAYVVEDLLTRTQIAQHAGYFDSAEAALHELRSAHTQSAAAWRGVLQAIWLRDGPVAARREFDIAPIPKAEIAAGMLWILMQSAPKPAQGFFKKWCGEADFSWHIKCRMLLVVQDTEAAFETCSAALKDRAKEGWSEADHVLVAQTAVEKPAYEIAKTALTQGLLVYPTNTRLLSLAGQLRFRQGDWSAASEFLENKVQTYPNNPGFLNLYRNILMQTGDYRQAALQNCDSADIASTENERRFQIRLARATGNIQNVFPALRLSENASYPTVERAQIASLEAMFLEGKLAEALRDGRAALEMFPYSSGLLLLCGKIAFQSGDIDLARSCRGKYHALSASPEPVLDTPDLVIQMARDAPATNDLLRNATGIEQALNKLLVSMPDAKNPTAWMQFIYRWMQGRAQPITSGPRRIPEQLLFYWEGDMNEPVATIIAEWGALFPSAVRHQFDRSCALKWLAEHDMKEAAVLMQAAESPATRADIFRLAFLSINGGIYIDTDERPVAAIDDWLAGCDLVLAAEKGHFTLANSFMACTPQHPVIVASLQRLLLEGQKFEGGLSTWLETGPALITRETGAFIHKRVAETGAIAGLRLLMPQEYSARVATNLKLPHKFLTSHWRRSDD